MRSQRSTIGPLLEKHELERVLAVHIYSMRNAAGFCTRAVHVLEAQPPNLVKGFVSGGNATSHDDHICHP